MDARLDQTEPDSEEITKLIMRAMRGVNGQTSRAFGTKVYGGPFMGMVIPTVTPWDDGNFGTKLFGAYEHELHDAIEYALWRKPRVLVNVGCAEGYYAVGLARHGLEVLALDISAEARLMCDDYAEKNGVGGKLTVVDGAYSPEELRFENVPGHRLYIVDAEGNEDNLLNPWRCKELITSDIIVECHDFLKPGVSSMLADRLSATHRVELIRPRLPDLLKFKFLEKFPTIMGVLMLVEKRPMPCYWLACWANSKGVSNG